MTRRTKRRKMCSHKDRYGARRQHTEVKFGQLNADFTTRTRTKHSRCTKSRFLKLVTQPSFMKLLVHSKRNPLSEHSACYKVVGNGNEDGNGNGNGNSVNSGDGGQGNQGHGDNSGGGGGNGGSLPSGSGGSGDGGSDGRGWSQGSGCNGAGRQDKVDQKQGNNPGEEGATDVDMTMNLDPEQHHDYTLTDNSSYILRGKSPRIYHDQLRARTVAQAPWDPTYTTRTHASGADSSTSTSYQNPLNASSDLMQTHSSTSSSRAKNTQGGSTKSSGSAPTVVRCGEVTARLLSALIQDAPVPPSFLQNAASNASTYIVHHGISKDDLTESSAGFGAPEDLMTSDGKEAETQLTPAQRQQNNLTEIEDRLKRELRALGLLEPTTTTTTGTKDDSDEICQELIKEQKRLTDQVIDNKTRRAKYFELVKAKIERQKQEQEERKAWAEKEENAIKQLKILKRKKRPLPAQPAPQLPPGKKARTATKTISTSHSTLDTGNDEGKLAGESQMFEEFAEDQGGNTASAAYSSYNYGDSQNLDVGQSYQQHQVEDEANIDVQKRDPTLTDNGFGMGANPSENLEGKQNNPDEQVLDVEGDHYQQNQYDQHQHHHDQTATLTTSQPTQDDGGYSQVSGGLAGDDLSMNYNLDDFSVNPGDTFTDGGHEYSLQSQALSGSYGILGSSASTTTQHTSPGGGGGGAMSPSSDSVLGQSDGGYLQQ